MGHRLIGRPSVGGAFLVNKTKYLETGGENEGFYGWARRCRESKKTGDFGIANSKN
ncbi:hypothetical protein ACIXP9_07595 [Bacteroides fragilis]